MPKRYKDCGFENFVVNENNKHALDTCKNFEIEGGNCITMVGSTGTGKTHLSVSVLQNINPVMVSTIVEEQNYNRLQWRLLKQDEGKREQYEKYLEMEMFKYRPAKSIFLPVVMALLMLNESFDNGGKIKMLEKFNSYDCVCLDDLGAEKYSEATRQNLYALTDMRYSNNRSLIITSNFSVAQIDEVDPRLMSRMAQAGDIIQFSGEDYRLK